MEEKRKEKFSWKFYNGNGGVSSNARWSLHYIRCSSRITSHLLPLLWFYKRSSYATQDQRCDTIIENVIIIFTIIFIQNIFNLM